MVDAFRARLRDGAVIVIDGGMGPELARRGVPMHPVAWAGPAAVEHPDAVRSAHEDYIRAGAEVIITNTFMASRDALEAAGLGDRFAEINRRSVELAVEARQNVGRDSVLIAGALFPGYFDPQTTEIAPEPTTDPARVRAMVAEQVSILAEGGADVIALEMIPSARWGRAALSAIAEVGLPVWLGVSVGRLQLEDGSNLLLPIDTDGDLGRHVALMLEGADADVMAVNVMHSEFDDVADAISAVAQVWSGPIGAYPHHGLHVQEPPHFKPSADAPQVLADMARGWVGQGVQMVGGCCGVGPEHIRLLSEQLPRSVPVSSR